MTPEKLNRQTINMRTAILWSLRSNCKRTQVGSVITNEEMTQVLSVGYNGPGKGLENDRCSGQSSVCGCVHAEANAVARLQSSYGKVMFVTTQPCELCAQLILNCDLAKVYFLTPYRVKTGLDILMERGLNLIQMSEKNPLTHWTDQNFEEKPLYLT